MKKQTTYTPNAIQYTQKRTNPPTWRVELRQHTDSAVPGVRDQVGDHLVGVGRRRVVRGVLLQLCVCVGEMGRDEVKLRYGRGSILFNRSTVRNKPIESSGLWYNHNSIRPHANLILLVYLLDTNGNDSASTMCQWRVFSFMAAIVSTVRSSRGTDR